MMQVSRFSAKTVTQTLTALVQSSSNSRAAAAVRHNSTATLAHQTSKATATQYTRTLSSACAAPAAVSTSRRSFSSSSSSNSDSSVEVIVVPDLGDGVKDCIFIKWNKEVGDAIEEDEVIGTIETDKVACDVRANGAGILREQLVQENAKVKVGAAIATVTKQ